MVEKTFINKRKRNSFQSCNNSQEFEGEGMN